MAFNLHGAVFYAPYGTRIGRYGSVSRWHSAQLFSYQYRNYRLYLRFVWVVWVVRVKSPYR
jgi:hypothetical protein